MEWVACNLCGGEEQKLLYQMPDKLYYPQELFNIVQCARCGLGFVNPRPTFDEIQRYYPKAFYEEFRKNEKLHLERYKREESYLLPIKKKVLQPTLLDIGCAEGGFLNYLHQRGWQVEGVEPFISDNGENPYLIHHDWFPNVDFKGKKFDVITAWAVLEHVHDPMAYFEKVAQLLNLGGIFVFLVNNLNSLQSRYLFAEDPPRHLYFFSERVIRLYAKKTGLRIIKVDYTDRVYEMPPRHWLEFLIKRILGKEFRYPPPLTLSDYLQKNNLQQPSLWDKFFYVLKNPISAIDAIGVPVITMLQKWFRCYGNTVYIAEKVNATL